MEERKPERKYVTCKYKIDKIIKIIRKQKKDKRKEQVPIRKKEKNQERKKKNPTGQKECTANSGIILGMKNKAT